jgi:SHAQKYF class myb-like DNA-binding protein
MPESARGGLGEESEGEAEPDPGEAAEKKARFVWTTEMHQRFEVAVQQQGLAKAKPQAIRQVMGCEGEEDAPTRQNIKSHLQKYRQHRQTSAQMVAAAAAARMASFRMASLPMPLSPAAAEEARARFEQYQLNLLQQLELQAKLHDQLLCQRHDQEALGCQLSHSAGPSMHPDQLMRMAQHVVFQRQLLQHLFALLQAHTEDVMRDGTRVRAAHITGTLRAHPRRPNGRASTASQYSLALAQRTTPCETSLAGTLALQPPSLPLIHVCSPLTPVPFPSPQPHSLL